MCGRYVSPQAADIEREWNLRHAPNPFDRVNYNVAPTQQVPAVRRGADGEPELVALRWGLVPFWAKGVPPKYGTINATIERMAEAPTYRGPWRRAQRCIVPAYGFYEWHQSEQAGRVVKQPYYIRIGDQPIFGMAGLWDASTAADGSTVMSCTLITLPANRVMAEIHNGRARMPAILARADHAAWLAGGAADALACLAPYADELMIAHRVATRVNAPRNNDAALIEPIDR
ncbi:MAG: SOS response-associated peptidase [Burkholderiales bacterium]|nr:SOS response-associated peptidase [Burkholderiales bacterium]